jgi:hypothetical protein
MRRQPTPKNPTATPKNNQGASTPNQDATPGPNDSDRRPTYQRNDLHSPGTPYSPEVTPLPRRFLNDFASSPGKVAGKVASDLDLDVEHRQAGGRTTGLLPEVSACPGR